MGQVKRGSILTSGVACAMNRGRPTGGAGQVKAPPTPRGGGRRGATSTRQQQTNTSKRGNEDRTYRQLSVILRNGGNGLIVQHREKRTKDGERERNRTNM